MVQAGLITACVEYIMCVCVCVCVCLCGCVNACITVLLLCMQCTYFVHESTRPQGNTIQHNPTTHESMYTFTVYIYTLCIQYAMYTCIHVYTLYMYMYAYSHIVSSVFILL